MATTITGKQIRDGDVSRDDLNIDTTGQAVITKVIAGTNINISSTGIDVGTGDVTINSTSGSSSWSTLYTSNTTYTFSNLDHLIIDATASMIYTLPISPSDDDRVRVTDHIGNFSTYNCTINRNGNLIGGLSENFVIDVSHRTVELIFVNSTVGWSIIF